MSTFNEGDQPYDDRHNTPPTPAGPPFFWPKAPAEGAMSRFTELPLEPQVDDNARSTANREARLDALAAPRPSYPTQLHASVDAVRYWLDHGVKPSGGIADDVRVVLDELQERMAEDVALSEPSEGEVVPSGLHYFFPHGAHVTNVANWAADGHAAQESTLNLRVLSAHLTTALDAISAELGRRL